VKDCVSPEQSTWGVINQPIGGTDILRYLSAAFRCGLYVNDRVCFDNKVQIADPFPLKPVEEGKGQVTLVECNVNMDDKEGASEAAP
jgi:hypothetical protein